MAATTLVVVAPAVGTVMLEAAGLIGPAIASVLVAMLASLALAAAGSRWWAHRRGSQDIVFADLMIWGWVRRVRSERRLAQAVRLLGLNGPEEASDPSLPPDRRAALLQQLSSALEARDPYTHGHSRRVTRHAGVIARRMRLSVEEVAKVRLAAAVHDVGKLELPREILNKPGALTDEEFATIKRHPACGASMVASLDDPEITEIVRHHHERIDGRGYPDGLRGLEIPVGARIIAVADTFDALTSSRPYRAAMPHRKAIDILRTEAGSQLDARAVTAFLNYYSGLGPVAWWSVAATAPARLTQWLIGALQGATAAPLATGATALGAAALVGGLGVAAPLDEQRAAGGQARAEVAGDVDPSRERGSAPPGASGPANPSRRPGPHAHDGRPDGRDALRRRGSARGALPGGPPAGGTSAGSTGPAAGAGEGGPAPPEEGRRVPLPVGGKSVLRPRWPDGAPRLGLQAPLQRGLGRPRPGPLSRAPLVPSPPVGGDGGALPLPDLGPARPPTAPSPSRAVPSPGERLP